MNIYLSKLKALRLLHFHMSTWEELNDADMRDFSDTNYKMCFDEIFSLEMERKPGYSCR